MYISLMITSYEFSDRQKRKKRVSENLQCITTESKELKLAEWNMYCRILAPS